MSTRADIEEALRECCKTYEHYVELSNRYNLHIWETSPGKTDHEKLQHQFTCLLNKVDKFPTEWHTKVCRALRLPTT